jgi:hypothetical protein
MAKKILAFISYNKTILLSVLFICSFILNWWFFTRTSDNELAIDKHKQYIDSINQVLEIYQDSINVTSNEIADLEILNEVLSRNLDEHIDRNKKLAWSNKTRAKALDQMKAAREELMSKKIYNNAELEIHLINTFYKSDTIQ